MSGSLSTVQCQGPDLDIRSLRLHSHSRGLASVYSSRDQTLVIQPFTYSLIPDIEAWCSKSDQYLLKSVIIINQYPDYSYSHLYYYTCE